MAGFDSPEHVYQAVAYETATDTEKDYASVLASAPQQDSAPTAVTALPALPELTLPW